MEWMRHSLTRYTPYFNFTFFNPFIDEAHIHRLPIYPEHIHVFLRPTAHFHIQGNCSNLSGIYPLKKSDVIECVR